MWHADGGKKGRAARHGHGQNARPTGRATGHAPDSGHTAPRRRSPRRQASCCWASRRQATGRKEALGHSRRRHREGKRTATDSRNRASATPTAAHRLSCRGTTGHERSATSEEISHTAAAPRISRTESRNRASATSTVAHRPMSCLQWAASWGLAQSATWRNLTSACRARVHQCRRVWE